MFSFNWINWAIHIICGLLLWLVGFVFLGALITTAVVYVMQGDYALPLTVLAWSAGIWIVSAVIAGINFVFLFKEETRKA